MLAKSRQGRILGDACVDRCMDVLTTVVAYLSRIHLKLPHHLDSHLWVLVVVVSCPIHIAERSVAHLLDQGPSLQAGISGQFAFALTFFGYYALEHGSIVVLGPLVTLLVLLGSMGSGMPGFGGLMPVITGSGGIRLLRLPRSLCVHLVFDNVGVAQGVVRRRGRKPIVIRDAAVLLRMNIGDMRRRLIGGGSTIARLLAVADEVLEVLYCRHGQRPAVCAARMMTVREGVIAGMKGTTNESATAMRNGRCCLLCRKSRLAMVSSGNGSPILKE